ncbi:DUF1772 domain-containing protein [Sphingorhabdus sp. IMCC26285]|uniref:DUF1772 domain-containing protein n=1 Tax=Sphingorhabdus profundilacus TaxID=2509718 RepID=A0A6I4LVZ9_9SPHN|nr:DUF1772 domain-containing protein [Sphingorhabdus profundilacus]MVZ97542.1 DUF1772 domain-containing protein [Sphingorhabdus profundilacus]
MLTGLIALTFAAAFFGAALYINVAEHPARMLLDDRNALAQWSPSYARAFNLQGGLAVLSGLAGFASAWFTGNWHWAIGAVLMIANWPYTLFGILPLNNRLNAISLDQAGPETRAMLERWNRLHRVRTILSGIAVAGYLWVAAA